MTPVYEGWAYFEQDTGKIHTTRRLNGVNIRLEKPDSENIKSMGYHTNKKLVVKKVKVFLDE